MNTLAVQVATILVCPPTDGPGPIVDVARTLAERYGARLVALHVLPSVLSIVDSVLVTAVMDDAVHARRAAARRWLAAIVAGATPDVVEGPFTERVWSAAHRVGADVIVVDTADAALLIGRAPCPVLGVPAGARA